MQPIFFRAMLRISAAYAVMRCLCVCLSVCLTRSWIVSKRDIVSSDFFSPSGSHTILVFTYQTGWRYSDGNPPNGGVECKWGRQTTTRFWTNIWLRCIQNYSVINRTSGEVWKIKAATNGGKRRALTAASVVRCSQKRTTNVCDGLDVIRRRRREVNPPPLVITVFCCRKTSLDRTRRVFLLKTDTNPHYWPYPIREAGSWPQPTHKR